MNSQFTAEGLPRSVVIPEAMADGSGKLDQYPFESGRRATRIYTDACTFLSAIHGRAKQGYVFFRHGQSPLSQVESLAWMVNNSFQVAPPPFVTGEELLAFYESKKGKVGLLGERSDGSNGVAHRVLFYAAPCDIRSAIESGQDILVTWCILALGDGTAALPLSGWGSLHFDRLELLGYELIGVKDKGSERVGFHWTLSKAEVERRRMLIEGAADFHDVKMVEEALNFSGLLCWWPVKKQFRAMSGRCRRLWRLKKDEPEPWVSHKPLALYRKAEVVSSGLVMKAMPAGSIKKDIFDCRKLA